MSIFYNKVDPAQTEHLLEHSPSQSWAVWPETELTTLQSLELAGDRNVLKGPDLKPWHLPHLSKKNQVKSSQENSNPSQFVSNWSPK